jgi:transcription-repair coupling factor (superfamily II helicase)
VPTPARARAIVEEASLFADGIDLALLPEREQLPYEYARDDTTTIIERTRALHLLEAGAPALVVASWAALSEHHAPRHAGPAISLAVGSAADPATLARDLTAAGYEPGHLAEVPGTFSRRGGIVDIYPAGSEHPVRVEFFGDEVESIRRVDVATQRSVGRLEAIRIEPLATATDAARDAARALLARLDARSEGAEAIMEELELIAAGQRSSHEQFFAPLLFEASALDWIEPGTTVAVLDAAEGIEALTRTAEHEERARREQEERGAIPLGLPPLRLAPRAAEARLLGQSRLVELSRFGSEELGATRLPLRIPPSFAGRLREVTAQVIRWAREGRRVIVASQQALRLAELLDAEGFTATIARSLPGLPGPGEAILLTVAVGGGLVAGDDLVLLSDAEIFGFRKRRRPTRTRRGVSSDLLATLEIGDYVVHVDHGIARYAGLVRRSIDGIEREYLELQYADHDRLYVPADQLELVSRYVGPADRAPALTRLGSQEWARAKRRVRQATLEMAHELLELYARRELTPGHAFAPDSAWQMELEAAFPFVETPEQVAAINDVKADMERPRPMDRLICGDVGYGKTEVAVRAAFKAVADGKQVAILVPTTVLAEQHGATFRERVAGFPVRVEVLSRFRSDQEQRAIAGAIASGDVDIAIGTHRLLQRDITFKDLGLVIIDEEQRFGVAHKERLKQLRAEVDFLTLSATPIPRTLQMSLAGIRDMSTIMTPPEERLPIRTYVLGWDDAVVREAITRELQRGGQVYFVHNRIHNIERVVGRLRRIVPEANIAVAHGQMHEDQLERVMMEFAAGEHDILVCTTIIESGLDIANANTILVNDADRFGLAQLYQLRGRVGRGANQAYAYLLHDRDRALSETAARRLEAIFEATELGAGFQIALRDLEIRGAGNILGGEQSGHIGAVGFDLYTKLMGEAVAALRRSMGDASVPPPLPPSPVVDLPLSAHIPDAYIEDIHDRLAVYQRIAAVDTVEGIAAMRDELRDRFGEVPGSVEHLLYVSLLKSIARRAGVESIRTDERMFQIHLRGGVTPSIRAAVEGLRLEGLLIGPQQVRIDRFTWTRDIEWMPLIVRILRAIEAISRADLAAA